MACFHEHLLAMELARHFCREDVVSPALRMVAVEKQSLLAPVMKGVRHVTREATSAVKDAVKDCTRTELVLGGVVLTTALYQGYKYSVPTKIFKGCSYLVPGYRWVCARMGRFKVVPAKQSHIGAHLESKRQGSEELPMTSPKNQATIAIRNGDAMEVVGCAVRMCGNVLVAPDHVLGEGNAGLVKCARSKLGVWLSLAGKVRIPLDADLVAIVLDEAEFSRLGLSNSNVGHMDEIRTTGQIVGPDGKGTVGNVSHDAVSFGRVIYTGSTLQGYSGAAYMKGNELLGIHQMGGAVNGGFSANYVQNLIHVHFKQRLESSPEWLLGQFERGKTVSWKSTGDPDTIQIKVSGRYLLMDREEMDSSFGTHWRDSQEIQRRSEVRHRDYESRPVENFVSASVAEASGEENSSAALGGSSVLTNTQGSASSALLQLTREFERLSNTQRRRYRSSLELLTAQIRDMAGQNQPSPQN
uniref:Uncharacterized protein n=1 Tax=Solemoviridae sp. TaxID=2715208 RepID=A0A6M3YQC5_9VIRU|nr:MAG: hypothetical protein 1 [Solemoviridae sp.]QJI53818.1 MAG: hypothetical protein 1 [Solemoviridae sp.]